MSADEPVRVKDDTRIDVRPTSTRIRTDSIRGSSNNLRLTNRGSRVLGEGNNINSLEDVERLSIFKRASFFTNPANFELIRSLQSKKTSYDYIVMCSTYIIAAASETWIINWFKQYGVVVPILFGMFENALWPVEAVRLIRTRASLETPRVLSYRMLFNYLLVSLVSAFVTLSRIFSISLLPPILSVIFSSTGIIFGAFMSKFIMHRDMSMYQYGAVLFIIFGIVISTYDPSIHGFPNPGNDPSYINGIMLMIASNFGAALNIVLADM